MPLLQSLTPRQVQLLASQQGGPGGYYDGRSAHAAVCNSGGAGTVREVALPYLFDSRDNARRERERADWCVRLAEGWVAGGAYSVASRPRLQGRRCGGCGGCTAACRLPDLPRLLLHSPPQPCCPPLRSYAVLLEEEGLRPQNACDWPSWQVGPCQGMVHLACAEHAAQQAQQAQQHAPEGSQPPTAPPSFLLAVGAARRGAAPRRARLFPRHRSLISVGCARRGASRQIQL